ncbi:MAG: hypothetical protein ACRYG8_54270, partial [Janthinobacterium lividum]
PKRTGPSSVPSGTASPVRGLRLASIDTSGATQGEAADTAGRDAAPEAPSTDDPDADPPTPPTPPTPTTGTGRPSLKRVK